MRCLALAILLVAAPARAEESHGYYGEVSAGPVQYRGDLAPYATDAVKVHVAFSARRGPWTYELITGGILDDTQRQDCPPATACRVVTGDERAMMDVLGGNMRYRWQLGRSRWHRLGLHFSLYGGPRFWWGDGALAEYFGTGVGGGSRVELDIWAIGYFVDVGMDALRLERRGEQLDTTMPYVIFGGKVGWL